MTRTTSALLVAFSIVVIVYAPGLWGPFLLDDFVNLGILREWLEGNVLWPEVVLGNTSGPFGRSLSMVTFLANAAVNGLSPFGYKLVNLVIHLVCMGLAAGFLRSLLQRDPTFRNYFLVAALGIAFWWAILPIHAATVLYVVQRMAQLSTLFIFGGLWLFVQARQRIENGHSHGTWMLWIGVPALTVIGALAKENALLLPLLCSAVEIGHFSRARRPRTVHWFFILTVLLPAIAIVGILLLTPEKFLRGFETREFGLIERLLTQTRVLWTYVAGILVPFGPRLGIFHDNYVLSTGLLQPVTTVLATGAWLGVLGSAWAIRTSAPAVLTGVLLFLFGHAMESSIFPLEMMFLHRNYMPALGLLLAVAGLGGYLAQHLPAPSALFRRTAPVFLVLIALVLCTATFGRAWVWQSEGALYAQELETNPNSVRTRTALATYALQRGHPRVALAQIEALESFAPPEHEATIVIWKLLIVHCQVEERLTSDLIQIMKDDPPERIHLYAAHAMGLVASQMEAESCGSLEPGELAEASRVWIDNVNQPDNAKAIVGFRYNTARLLAKAGRLDEALLEAFRAWEDGGRQEFPIGVLAFRLAASLEDYDTCQKVLAGLDQWADSHDLRKRRTIQSFQQFLENPDGYPDTSQHTSE